MRKREVEAETEEMKENKDTEERRHVSLETTDVLLCRLMDHNVIPSVRYDTSIKKINLYLKDALLIN